MSDPDPPDHSPVTDLVTEAFFTLHHDLPRQSPGSDATTRRLLEMAGPLPERPRVLDAGCGPGRSTLLPEEEAGAHVTAVDLHQPFLDGLAAEAARRGLGHRITVVNCSMDRLPVPDHSFDVIWAEGSAYTVGFDVALRASRRLLAPGGVLAITEIEWTKPSPAAPARASWDAIYPLRTHAANTASAQAAGYRLRAHWPLPESNRWDEYYTPLTQHMALADPQQPGMPEALAAHRTEIDMRREHGGDYCYAAYLLSPDDTTENGIMTTWTARPETADDMPVVRDILLAAFPTDAEADIVDALRADPKAWIDGLSMVAAAPDSTPVGYALLTRCHVDGEPALALAPCAVLPSVQRTGAGSAAIRAALAAAGAMGENLVLVLGHADYYPRFGFTPASRFGIRAPFEVPDEVMMAMALDDTRPVPAGTIQYPVAFGV
ncbi:GNAT family N-acetyltransferase [Streptomyces sp. NPDC051018]|uniref:GNAT family N-acetyltransferase n=1 Tax=Streptomyces sp. NPDC051018 TaxID=3365639 RepID=UPI0037A221FC